MILHEPGNRGAVHVNAVGVAVQSFANELLMTFAPVTLRKVGSCSFGKVRLRVVRTVVVPELLKELRLVRRPVRAYVNELVKAHHVVGHAAALRHGAATMPVRLRQS